MTPAIIALIALLGAGTTVVAADHALPGDTLYPLDRTIENVELAAPLPASVHDGLVKKMTKERITELRDIIDQEVTVSPTTLPLPTSTAASATATTPAASSSASSGQGALTIAAREFTDTTIITVGLDGQEVYLETAAKDKPGIIATVKNAFPSLTVSQISLALSIKTIDRQSTVQDKGVVSLSSHGEARIATGVHAVLDFLNNTSLNPTQRQVLTEALSNTVNGITKDINVSLDTGTVHIGTGDNALNIRLDANGNAQVDVSQPSGQVRVQDTNGDINVRTASASTSVPKAQASSTLSVTAHVFTDTTLVTVGIAGQAISFETVATTPDGIAAAVHSKFTALTPDAVKAVLKIVEEHRQSTQADTGIIPTPKPTTHRERESREHSYRSYERGDD